MSQTGDPGDVHVARPLLNNWYSFTLSRNVLPWWNLKVRNFLTNALNWTYSISLIQDVFIIYWCKVNFNNVLHTYALDSQVIFQCDYRTKCCMHFLSLPFVHNLHDFTTQIKLSDVYKLQQQSFFQKTWREEPTWESPSDRCASAANVHRDFGTLETKTVSLSQFYFYFYYHHPNYPCFAFGLLSQHVNK